MSDEHFKVKIENPERRGQRPTYAVLGEGQIVYQINSYERPWELKDTLQLIREAAVKPRCMIMLIADQQTPSVGTDDETNKLFGQYLTGAKRVLDGVMWNGDYVIERYEDVHSVAGNLYDAYNHFPSIGPQESDAIIVDVPNPNNNWLYGKKRKDRVANELSDSVVKRILHTYEESGLEKPALIFAGFGRGALLAYHLAKKFADEVDEVVLVSIDPRVNEGRKDEKGFIHKWGRMKNKQWTFVNKRPRLYKRGEYFPVLDKLDKVKCYNVFQRHDFEKSNSRSAAWPVGCAIEGAQSPNGFGFSLFDPYDCHPPGNQGDNSIHEHSTKMLDRYASWIAKVVEYEGYAPIPVLTNINPDCGHAGTTIRLTGSYLDNSIIVIKDYLGSHEVVAVSVNDDGHESEFEFPSGLAPGMKKICVRKNDIYSDELDFNASPCITALGAPTQMPGSNVALHGYFIGKWNLLVAGEGINVVLDIGSESSFGTDEKVFEVPRVGSYARPVVGPVTLQAKLNDSVLLGDSFDFVIAPYIESIEPSSGIPGSDVTVKCYVVTLVDVLTVTNTLRFHVDSTPISLEGDVTAGLCVMNATVPNIYGGNCFVEINTTMGVNSNIVDFTILAAISGFNPAVPETGDTIDVNGLGFAIGDRVLINNLDVSATVVDQNTLSFTLLAGIGEKEVMVVSEDGRCTDTVTLGVAPYMRAAYSPTSGLPSEEIQLKGYFKRADSSPSGGNQLSYRGTPIPTWLADEKTLVFTVPEVAAGDGELEVTSASGHVSNIINFAVKAKIKAFPKRAARPGEVFMISGVNFTEACSLQIDGKLVPASYIDSETYHWSVPDDAEPGPKSAVVVDTTTGLAGNEVGFGVTPYIASLSAEREAPGATIVVHGFFSPDDHIQVEGEEAKTELTDELTLSFTMPLLRRGGSGEVAVIEGERRSNNAHCEVNFVPWPVMKTRSGGGGEYHWVAAMDGDCYHRADCWRVERIEKEGLLGFASREDAWLFGFEPCHCVTDGGKQEPKRTMPANYVSDATQLKRSFDFPYYGNVNTRELHREPCIRRVARNIPLDSRIGFHDMDEAHALGFDNCYYCIGDSTQ